MVKLVTVLATPNMLHVWYIYLHNWVIYKVMLVNIPYMEHMGLLEESFKRCPWSWLTLKLLGCRSKQFSAHSGWGNEHCKDLPF